ncbi:MAG: undecaprenyldiphospho-muramoylpentapeptide beta-N-acetylglucosaminyltransferase [Deltaproteobacteria bacterium]|nr:undecaprenyldiphospho-muramoylpentapeptide beta-N-acetylglucosaminyltransferase [Deltaproteobacteria bacterium]
MRVIIAGGGTGGHLFPGIAVAEELMERDRNNRVLFVGTSAGLEARVLPGRGIPLRTITVRGIKGKSISRKAGAVLGIPRAVVEAFGIIREFHPDLVLGLGAYVAGPMLVAAFLAGTRRAVQEQNVIPGTTNRISAPLAHRVFVSFEETLGYFSPEKAVLAGNPIRREFALCRGQNEREGFGLLVFGGSRGAHRINQAMVESLGSLEDLRPNLRVVHQTGAEDARAVAEAYRRRGFTARVEPFIEDMAAAYRQSRLVVCRAGATTIAELAACGRASILVPYPFAANNHQEVNARNLVRRGAAMMILDRDLSGETMAEAIRSLFRAPEQIEAMERASASLGRPDAAKRIVDECYRIVEGRS